MMWRRCFACYRDKRYDLMNFEAVYYGDTRRTACTVGYLKSAQLKCVYSTFILYFRSKTQLFSEKHYSISSQKRFKIRVPPLSF